MEQNYPTNLTDSQYDTILRIIGDKRKRKCFLGLLLVVKVHAANEHDSKAAFEVIEQLKGRCERMKMIYADGGYRGEQVDKVKNKLGYDMEITLRSDKSTAFKPLPKRWAVERSFSWFESFRRLAKDYERTCKSARNMIYLAFISLMLKWL